MLPSPPQVPPQPFVFPFLWGLCVLASWIGWGYWIGRWILGKGREPDASLCAGWGLCGMLVIGGVLNAARLCSPAMLSALVVIGLIGTLPLLLRHGSAIRDDPSGATRAWLKVMPLVIWGAIILAGSVDWTIGEINPADDLANYLMYPVKMLQTGAAIDPFNIRRLSTFGGFAFLQAVIGVVGTEKNAFLLDIGLGSVVVVILLAGAIRQMRGPVWAIYLVAATCWLYWMPRVNTMAAWIGTATVLTMLRTFLLREGEDSSAVRGRLWVALAMSAAACCSLRANYLPVPVLFLAAAIVWEGFAHRRAFRSLGGDVLVLGASFVAMLLPWSLALREAAGSMLYPLFKGNHRGEFFFYSSNLPLTRRLVSAAEMMLSPKLARLVPCLLVLPFVRAWPVLWLYLAALVTTAATTLAFSNSEIEAISRYTVPLLLAPALFGIATLLSTPARGRARYGTWAGVACAILLLGDAPVSLLEIPRHQWSAASVAWSDDLPAFPPPFYGRYAAMQQSIPSGASVASVVDFPSLWDFRRNHIVCLDFPGAAVPRAKMPFFQGDAALLGYLRSEGIDYLAYNDFQQSRGMYHRDWYASLVHHPEIQPMNRVAVHMLDFMANVDTLAMTQPLVFDQWGIRVLRINDRAE